MTESIRVFIAVEIDRDIQSMLGNLVTKIQKTSTETVKWIPDRNIHLTLKFLGDVDTWELGSIQQLLRDVANQSRAISAIITQLGAFPSLSNPRVIWIGLDAPSPLFQLARVIEESTRNLGFSTDNKPFTPHLTLGRVRSTITKEQQNNLSKCLRSIHIPIFKPIQIQSITLFQSILKPGGSEYYALTECRFNH